MLRVSVSRAFGAADSPMLRALDWIAEQENANPSIRYILVSREALKSDGSGTYRQFFAYQRAVFLRHAVDQRRKQHWHEIVRSDQPCRLYCDVEFYRTPAVNAAVDGDALMGVFVALLGAALQRDYGLHPNTLRVVQTDASKETKFSRHVVVHLAADDAVAFADSRACGQFVAKVVHDAGDVLTLPNPQHPGGSAESIVDLGVYSANHGMRVVNSAKITEPLRPLLLWRNGGAVQTFDASEKDVSDALVSVQSAPKKLLDCESAGTKRSLRASADEWSGRGGGKRVGSTTNLTLSGSVLPDDVRAIVNTVDEMRQADINRCTAVRKRGEIYLETRDRECPIAQRMHKSSTRFFVVNLIMGKWRESCRHSACFRAKQQWKQLPDDLEGVIGRLGVETMQLEPIGVEAAKELLS